MPPCRRCEFSVRVLRPRSVGLRGARSIGEVATPLPPIDVDQVDEFWTRVVSSGVVDPSAPQPTVVEPFGDSRELADELLALILDGPKRATAAALADFEHDQTALPVAGGMSIATDGQGRARAVLRTTDVRVGPLSSVDDAFAWDEGEGDRTRRMWLADHTEFFERYLPTIGLAFEPNMPTVFERFEVLYSE